MILIRRNITILMIPRNSIDFSAGGNFRTRILLNDASGSRKNYLGSSSGFVRGSGLNYNCKQVIYLCHIGATVCYLVEIVHG